MCGRVPSAVQVSLSVSAGLGDTEFHATLSVLPSPDHLFFMGLTRSVVWAVHCLLLFNMRLEAEVSLRDARSQSRLHWPRSYNLEDGIACSGNTTTKWAAVLAVALRSFRSVFSADTMSMAIQVIVEVPTIPQSLVGAIHAYLRIDLDGAEA